MSWPGTSTYQVRSGSLKGVVWAGDWLSVNANNSNYQYYTRNLLQGDNETQCTC